MGLEKRKTEDKRGEASFCFSQGLGGGDLRVGLGLGLGQVCGGVELGTFEFDGRVREGGVK